MQIADTKGLDEIKNKSVKSLNNKEKKQFEEYYLSAKSKPYGRALKKLEKERLVLVDSMNNVQQIMVMKERKTPR